VEGEPTSGPSSSRGAGREGRIDMEWRRRHVLGLSDFRPEEIEFVV